MVTVIDRTPGPPIERIIGVAIIHNGRSVILERPARHGDVIKALAKKYPDEAPFGGMQGFATTRFPFVNRTWAYKIAKAAGQTNSDGPELYSEDVW